MITSSQIFNREIIVYLLYVSYMIVESSVCAKLTAAAGDKNDIRQLTKSLFSQKQVVYRGLLDYQYCFFYIILINYQLLSNCCFRSMMICMCKLFRFYPTACRTWRVCRYDFEYVTTMMIKLQAELLVQGKYF